ncbi:MAG TPA: hypothetical protein V6D50_03530 [Chroococcales cyanobacterium]|jgi:hypothetical protein
MDNSQVDSEISRYPVRVWEVILILIGAMALISAACFGLGIKVLNNAFNPARAEAIAKSLLDYKIPGGSQGIFGLNIGSVTVASVYSHTTPPDVVLVVGEIPLTRETDRESAQDFEVTPSDNAEGNFTVTASHTENKAFCGKTVPVLIEQGKQTFNNQPSPFPAIRYSVRTVVEDVELVVILTTSGDEAKEKVVTVFNSLRCKNNRVNADRVSSLHPALTVTNNRRSVTNGF